MNTLISVLDHGFVRLVSYMQPVPYEIQGEQAVGRSIHDEWTGDLEIVRNARVSYDADWRTGDDEGKDAKLVNYLMTNHHTSPFESMVFTFEVKAPIFVFRQWHRHRTWSYNEVSARYAELPAEFYVPKPEHIGAQSKDSKQARDMTMHDLDVARYNATIIHDACLFSLEKYKRLLELGCPRELARGVLPVNTYSRMFATVDLHNLFHFLRLRLHSHAQYEIRVYAQALFDLVSQICPVACKAWVEAGE